MSEVSLEKKELIYKGVKIGVSFALGLLLFIISFTTYRNRFDKFYELTFLSNMLTGVFFLVVGVLTCCGKKVPGTWYLIITPVLLLVLGVSVIMNYGFFDGLLFMHCLNPILVLAYFLFLSNLNDTKFVNFLYVNIIPISYLIFAFIHGSITGDYVYDFINYKEFGIGNTILFIGIACVVVLGITIGLYFLNRFIHKKILKYAY